MNENENLPEGIKVCIAPTWEQDARERCLILRNGSPDGKDDAQQHILRMARILDQMGVRTPW